MTTSNTSTSEILNTVCTRLSPVHQKWFRILRRYSFSASITSRATACRSIAAARLSGLVFSKGRWLGTQLPVQWKATESERCQFMPDGRDLDNGEKLDSGSVTKCSLVRENASCQSSARESSIQASNAESRVG